jgi:hypothetical protein
MDDRNTEKSIKGFFANFRNAEKPRVQRGMVQIDRFSSFSNQRNQPLFSRQTKLANKLFV